MGFKRGGKRQGFGGRSLLPRKRLPSQTRALYDEVLATNSSVFRLAAGERHLSASPKRGCIGCSEYSYLKPTRTLLIGEFSYDIDTSYIRGPYFMHLMIECKYRHPGARWVFAPAEYGGPDELESNDFLHVVDDFMAPKFAYRSRFPRTLAPLCSKGVELLADGANEKTITQSHASACVWTCAATGVID